MAAYVWTMMPFQDSLRIYIELEQTTPSTSPSNYGASQVRYRAYVSSDSGYNYQNHKIYLKIGNEVVYNVNNASLRLYANKVFIPESGSGWGTTSTYFERQENGKLNVPCTFIFAGYNKSQTVFTYNCTFYGETFTMYSKCNAPTSFSCTTSGVSNGSIIAPVNLGFSWSGASAGTNNTITGYTIYYKIASSLTYPTISDYTGQINIDNTETSAIWTVGQTTLESNRGKYIAFKILTVGTITNYDSDLSTASFYIKVNSLPTAPNITYNSSSVTSIIIPSTATSVQLGISGSTDADNQTISYYYGSTLINSSPCYIPISATTTINFYAFDTLESSVSKTVTVTKNTAPQISAVTLTGTTYTAGAGVTYMLSVKPSIKVSKKGVGTVNIDAIIRTSSTSGPSVKTVELSSKAVASNSSIVSFETFYVQKILGDALGQDYNSSNTYWVNFKVTYDDGIQTVTSTYFADKSSREIKSAPAPSSGSTSDILIYNQFTDLTDISNTNHGQVYDKIKVVCYNDNSLDPTKYTCSAKFGNTTYSLSFTTGTTGTYYRYFNISLLNIPPADTEGTITITGTDGYVTKTFTTWAIKETKVPYMGGAFSSTIGTINMFQSQPLNYTNTLAWPFDEYASYSAACSDYNLSSSSATAIKVRLTYGNSIKDCSLTVSNTPISNNLSSTVTPENLFDWSTTYLDLTPYQGTKNLTIQYVITNLFGQEFVSATKTIKFNFNRVPTIGTITLKYADTSTPTSKSTLGDGKSLQEGALLYLKIGSLGLYTTEQITINIYVQSAGNSSVLPKTLKKTVIYSQGSLIYGSGYNSPGNNTSIDDISYGELPELTASSYKFTIEVIGQYSGKSTTTKTVNAIKRQPSNSILQSCTFTSNSGNGTWNYQAVFDNGFGGTEPSGANVTYQLFDSNNNEASAILQSSSDSVSSTISQTWSTIYLKLKTKIVMTPSNNNTILVQKTYEYYSNLVIVYAKTATVAYRVHSIGINTGSIENDGIVEIHGIDGKDKIILKNQSAQVSNSAVIDLSALTLSLYLSTISPAVTTSTVINLMEIGKTNPVTTASTAYLFGGSSTTGNIITYTNTSCYMSGGYLYSGGTKVDMGELYKLNPTTNTGKRFLTAVSNTTGIQLVNTNVSCYMSSGYLYSNNVKVDMAELYKVSTAATTATRYLIAASTINSTTKYTTNANASCYMSNGHLYSNAKKVMTLITSAQTTTSNYYIKGSPSTGDNTGSEQLYDNSNCYMLNGHLYSNAQQVASITLATQGSTTSYYIKGSSTGNGSELYSNVNCYMLNGFLYSGGLKVDPEKTTIVPLYINAQPSNSTTTYPGICVGMLALYKVSDNERFACLDFQSKKMTQISNQASPDNIKATTYNIMDKTGNSTYTVPTDFKPSSDVTLFSGLHLLKLDGSSVERTGNTTITMVLKSDRTITVSLASYLGRDGWFRQSSTIY